ncbi:MAG: hypothetical protein IJB83_05900 [Bacilli bacterium]|nr:hypothetical protein [Bacilli bacterium]
MKIEINNKHKKANISNLNLYKNRFVIFVLSIALSVSLMSGCTKKANVKNDISNENIDEITLDIEEDINSNLNYNLQTETNITELYEIEKLNSKVQEQVVTIINEDGTIDIPENYRNSIYTKIEKSNDEKITLEDLKNIDYIFLTITDNSDLTWLKYCTNLKDIHFYISHDDLSNLNILKDIPNLETLSLINMGNYQFNKNNFGFLEDATNITGLTLYNFSIEPNFIENLKHLKNLSLLIYERNCDIDYSKLTFLDSLNFVNNPYSVAIDFKTSDYNTLINNGVNVSFSDNPDNLELLLSVNKKLDSIVSSLNLNENSTDQEKLDAILIYVLDNLSYDEEVSNAVNNNMPHSKLTQSFYEGGMLHAVFEKNSAICGNYAALTDALSNRVNLDSFVALSDNHAWNLIEIEGEHYYVDATWLDHDVFIQQAEYGKNYDGRECIIIKNIAVSPQDIIKEGGDTSELEWYMKDPTKVEDDNPNESHEIINLPSYISIKPIEENIENNIIEEIDNIEKQEQITDISNKKFKISINKKTWIITGGALVGILSGLGIAIKVSNKNRNKYRKQLQNTARPRYNNYPTPSRYYDYNSQNNYDYNQKHHRR